MLKQRRTFEINPRTRIHNPGEYNRSKEKDKWKKELEEDDESTSNET